jgi:4-hydroxyphenylpyruvate dioxygenase
VLNREPDSAAAEHFSWHGPSVCALALRVDDVAAALTRADAMQCPPWSGPVGSGERHIPAVRAPDGMLIHLVQPDASGRSIWEDDFLLTSESGPGDGGIGLTSIDHIAEALPANGLHGAVLFWRAVFGLEAAAPMDLSDPYGLVRSRAMISRGGGFRLPLNVSDSRDTMTGRFVATSSGAGVQHIAFATADVAAAVSALREGAPMLPIAGNYYDDLAARWDLDDADLARMQALHLLYDREPGGVFLHAYTDMFEGRFFFELVERRGAVGFGAANASFRIAAQASRFT